MTQTEDPQTGQRAAASRISLYLVPDAFRPAQADPFTHTMGEVNFLKYIGRSEAGPTEIRTKKFTGAQSAAVFSAFSNDHAIRVLSALGEDMPKLAHSLGYVPVGTLITHDRTAKQFNNRRSTLCWFRKKEALDDHKELWVAVFPSRQYVDQIAQLIQAILDNLEVVNHRSYGGEVTTWHFSEIERTIPEWTGFHTAIKPYVRHGDVVAIGNIEFFLPGLEDAGFQGTNVGWTDFGLNDMFAVKTLVDEASHARIILVGVRECFWGEAAAQYARSLIEAGARHILYGSKAASLVKADTVHEVIAPRSFLTITSDYTTGVNPELEHKISFSGAHQAELAHMLDMFGIHQGGLSVTVPTVVGEDIRQREAYDFQNPTCMDCENGHIAQVIHDHNEQISGFSSTLQHGVKFVPVHFITDYIYRSGEAFRTSVGHLAVHATDPDYERRRNAAFRWIGRFFALYTLKYGQREYSSPGIRVGVQANSDVSLETAIDEIRPFLDFGYGREAIAVLMSLYRPRKAPANTLLALAMVGQKYGFSSVFLQAEYALRNEGARLLLDNDVRLSLFRLKHRTQVGDIVGALEVANRMNSDEVMQLLREIDQYCAFQRRLAICLAASGDREGFENAMARSEEDAPNQDDREQYQNAINLLWRHIGRLHLGEQADHFPLETIASDLSQVRNVLGSLESKVWWQSNLEKGAVAALYLEAAFFLLHGDRRQRMGGLDRLYLASLLNVRVGGHEQSEAYGEIVTGVSGSEVREGLLLAMRTDLVAQNEFQKLVAEKNPASVGLVHRCLALLRSSRSARERELQELITHA